MILANLGQHVPPIKYERIFLLFLSKPAFNYLAGNLSAFAASLWLHVGDLVPSWVSSHYAVIIA